MDLLKNIYFIIKCLHLLRGHSCEHLVFNPKGPINCVSLNNQPCKARPTLVNINYNQPLFYPLTISVNNCGGGCNTMDDPYARVRARIKVKIESARV